MPSHVLRGRSVMRLGVLLSLAGCATEPQVVATIDVSPSGATLTALGATQQFTAVARDSRGAAIRGKQFGWQSLEPEVITVDAGTGLATAVTSGTTAITATAEGVTGQATVTVAQAASQLAFVARPTDATAGEALAPAVEVEIRDARGNRVVGATDAVTIGLGTSPAGAVLEGTIVVTAVDGTASFADLVLTRAGSGYTLIASSGSLPAAISAGFEITPAAPAQLAFTAQPTDATAGVAIAPAVRVTITDQFGNPVPSATPAVTVALGGSPDGVELFGTTTVEAVAGEAQFDDLSIRRAASGYALAASSGTLQGAASEPFAVLPGPLVQLVFTAQPPGTVEGNVQFSSPVDVGLRDEFDNIVPTGQVALGLGANPWGGPDATGGTLSGTLSVAAVDGVARFSNLRVDKPGAGYTLEASTDGIAVESSPFAVGLTFYQIGRGLDHTCAVTMGGGYCWGSNAASKLGSLTGSTSSDSVPALVRTDITFAQLMAGIDHTCGLTSGGAAYCWGGNDSGQVGNGNHMLAVEPVRVVTPAGVTFTMLSAGLWHTCGLTTSGAAYCWGANGDGQVGDGTNASTAVPVLVSGALSFTAVHAGGWHTCGVTADGTAYCWGRNSSGQLGDSTTTPRPAPVRVKGPDGLVFDAVGAGQNHTCSLATDGAAYCWGSNGAGELGDGTSENRSAPVAVTGGLTFAVIAPGAFHSCGLAADGALYCWGNGLNGELGDGFDNNRDSPTLVSGGHGFDMVASGGGLHTCARAVSPSTALLCWGANGAGQLGDGTRVSRSEPVFVVQ